MSDPLLIDALGVGVEIEQTDLPEPWRLAMDAAWADARLSSRPAVPVRVGLSEITKTLEGALAMLSQDVTRAALAAQRGTMWMLHAAGLAWADGRVVVLVAPSGHGKTTAARTLGRRLGYVSDETIAIRSDGTIVPFRKPLSIIESSEGPKVQRAPSELGLLPLPEAPLRLGALVVLARDPDAPAAELVPMSLDEAVADILPQSSYLAEMASPLQTALGHIGSVGGVVRAVYRDASELYDLLERHLHGVQPRTVPIVAGGAVTGSSAGIARAACTDWVIVDDPARLIVLQAQPSGESLVRIVVGLAPTLWRAADGVPFDDVLAAVREELGDPPEGSAEELVRAGVDALVAEGILRVNTG